MARGRINIPLNYMPPAEVGTSEPTLPARKLPEVGLQSLEGAASVLKPIAEMLPGSGFVTGVQKGGSKGGADVLAELLGIVGGLAVGGPPGAIAGPTIVKVLRKLLDDQNNMIPVSEVKKPIAKKDETKLEEKSLVKYLSSLLDNSDKLDNYQAAWKAENKVRK